jgi:hypothetical protein
MTDPPVAERRKEQIAANEPLARFDAEMRQAVARIRERASNVTGATATHYLLASVKHQSAGVNATKLADDTVAAQHGDRLAALRLRRAARAPLLVRRVRPPLRRPSSWVARIRPREHRSASGRTSRGSPDRPTADDDPDLALLEGRRR